MSSLSKLTFSDIVRNTATTTQDAISIFLGLIAQIAISGLFVVFGGVFFVLFVVSFSVWWVLLKFGFIK